VQRGQEARNDGRLGETACHVRLWTQHASVFSLAAGNQLAHQTLRAGFCRQHIHRHACLLQHSRICTQRAHLQGLGWADGRMSV